MVRAEDAGVRPARFSILTRQTITPAIMIEAGYLSDSEDAAGIVSESWRQALAESIAGGVQNCLAAWGRGKTSTPAEPASGP